MLRSLTSAHPFRDGQSHLQIKFHGVDPQTLLRSLQKENRWPDFTPPAAGLFRRYHGRLLHRRSQEKDLTIIVFTLDETSYARELAPLAGAYPALKLGPAWWFHDSPEDMRRFREMTTETAGFYNTVGFNDDTRAFCSIPARHDVSRRVDCAFLATLVATGRLSGEDAFEVANDLAYRLAKQAYRL